MEGRKIVILGDRGVGKTALTMQYQYNYFPGPYDPTIVDLYKVNHVIDGKICNVHILDTGDWPPPDINSHQFRNYALAVYVYDITKDSSFTRVEELLRDTSGSLHNTSKAVVGNKADMLAERKVSMVKGQELARHWAATFFETSAREGRGVEEAFSSLAMHRRVQDKEEYSMYGLRSGFDDAETPTSSGIWRWLTFLWTCL